MNRFTFVLNIEGLGETPQAAWEDAMERLIEGTLNNEYSTAPGLIYQPDETRKAATENLVTEPYQEFGIDHGVEELEGKEDLRAEGE